MIMKNAFLRIEEMSAKELEMEVMAIKKNYKKVFDELAKL